MARAESGETPEGFAPEEFADFQERLEIEHPDLSLLRLTRAVIVVGEPTLTRLLLATMTDEEFERTGDLALDIPREEPSLSD